VGSQLNSVVCNNGILYISGTISPTFLNTIASYSRAAKTKIAQTSSSDYLRIKLVPGSNTELYGISTYNETYHFIFDNNGNYLTTNANMSSNNYYPIPNIFEVFPDGNNMITGTVGVIINKSLTYVSTLPHGNTSFTAFWFDSVNQIIYAGCTKKMIQAYSMSNYKLSNSFGTEGYVCKVFYNNGSVISVSTSKDISYAYSTDTAGVYTTIEEF
jgi:hypothetical protein